MDDLAPQNEFEYQKKLDCLEMFTDNVMYGRCPICHDLVESIPGNGVRITDSKIKGGFFVQVLCELIAHLAYHIREVENHK